MPRVLRASSHLGAIALLTILTQLGGLAWLCALAFKRFRIALFIVFYVGFSLAATQASPISGRVPLDCSFSGSLQMRGFIFCALNRHYVVPELKAAMEDVAEAVEAEHPGTITQLLDASFPFLDGFPMLPHLSHDDGQKIDLAFYYTRNGAYDAGGTPSPIGFFAFEDGPTDCPKSWLTLRWDLAWLQPFWPDMELDIERTATLVEALADDPRIGKILLEPHLKASMGIESDKVRFQGCRAARHDDHIHVQL